MTYILYTLDYELIEEVNYHPDNFTGIVECPPGNKHWYLNGEFHRAAGPAIVWPDGSKFWYFNGQCHRIDGPAFEYGGGKKYWYIDGKKVTEQEHNLLCDIMKLKGLL